MNPALIGIGIANPEFKQQQKVAAEIIATALRLSPMEKRRLQAVYRATGIEYRHSVLSDFCKSPGEYEFFPNDPELPFPTTAMRMQAYKKYALSLALNAIKNCFSELSHVSPQSITHVITVSCTGMYAPGLDIEITQALQLNTHVKRTCINFMGCYGAFNGIKTADAICRADPTAKVLVVSVELCTLHFQKTQTMDNLISNAIFSDGAAAVLITTDHQQEKYFSLEGFYCDLLPQHHQEMAWHIADSGFDIVLSSYVPQAIEKGIAAFVERLLQQQAIKIDDIDLYAIHPGGYKILQACESALNISAQDNRYAYQVLRQYGNMSSATVLFVLKHIWDDAIAAQSNIFSCAFGPGLTLESMILRTS